MITEADALLKDGKFDEAFALYNKAEETCKNSSAAKATKPNDNKPKVKKDAKPKAGAQEEETVEDESKKILPPPGQIIAKGDESSSPNYAINTEAFLADLKRETDGNWRTRFPPEPNGYLHIGHGKAMNFVFGVAKRNSGDCILRFDDTNPTAEKQEYIDSIIRNVEWLGHKPVKTTYSSDYFQTLFDYAIQLIKQGDAYVCSQSQPEVKASREVLKLARQNAKGAAMEEKDLPAEAMSPDRNRPIAENLKMFERMRKGFFKEGEVCLRLKMDLTSDIPSMWDTAAYRIMYHEHPHSKDKWCIYPTYDYTHCIVDSLEYITHSLCTLEFGTRQAPDGSYYWLLDKLGIYKPITWESSRCNITYNVLSKRKLNALVTDGLVNGWDDPRLLTLEGLRRRGYTANAINKFCEVIGVTRNEGIVIKNQRLEHVLRMELDETANRAFAVIDPLKVSITNHPGTVEVITQAKHPKKPERGNRDLPFGKCVYIERSDFREEDVPGYYGLAPGKSARLLNAYNITCDEVVRDGSGNIVELKCTYDADKKATMPKGKLHWVEEATAVQCEMRLYSTLFLCEEPVSE
jgi:glutaminyl-tRNA synthetase